MILSVAQLAFETLRADAIDLLIKLQMILLLRCEYAIDCFKTRLKRTYLVKKDKRNSRNGLSNINIQDNFHCFICFVFIKTYKIIDFKFTLSHFH